MARDRFEERIRVYIESMGDAELQRLVESIGDLGDATEDQATRARTAMQRFADALDVGDKVRGFADLKRDLQATKERLESAQDAAQKLNRELSGDTSAGARRQLSGAAAEVNKLKQQVEAQSLALQRTRRELSAAGIDTRQLGSAQAELNRRMADSRVALAETAGAINRTRIANAQAAERMQADNRQTAASYDQIGRKASGLRGVLAGLGAYLGFREAAQGVVALGKLASEAENAERSFGRLYGSQERGAEVVAELRTLAKENGLAFQQVADDAKRLKAFGLDPLNGSYQALIDQNAAMGGSQEQLSGIVLALGQAWAKQKLQGEEILQLVERGVPVWALLEQATGKNVKELQKLSEQGKLGRETIQALYQEIGKANAGAAREGLSSLSGLVSQVTAQWKDFWLQVADQGGVADYLQSQLKSLLDSTGGMEGLAQRVGAAIIGTLDALKRFGQQLAPIGKLIADTTLFLGKHAEAIALVAKAWLALKVADAAGSFIKMASSIRLTTAASIEAAAAANAQAAGLGKVAGAAAMIPRLIKFSLIGLGIEAAIAGLQKTAEVIDEVQKAQSRLGLANAQLQRAQAEQVERGQELQRVYKQFSDVGIHGAREIATLTAEQGRQYKYLLQESIKYYQGVQLEAHRMGDATKVAFARERIDGLNGALKETEAQLGRLAERAKGTRIDGFVDVAVKKFDELVAKGDAAAKAISGAFNGLDFTRADGIKGAADLIEQITARGQQAALAVQVELGEALKNVAASDLPAIAAAAEHAFGAGSKQAQMFAGAVDGIRFDKLGVDIEEITTGMSKARREVVTTFQQFVGEIDKLGLTAEQRAKAVGQAFDNAISGAKTKQEVEALQKALRDALDTGSIGMQDFQRRTNEATQKLQQLSGVGAGIGDAVEAGAQRGAAALDNLAGKAKSISQINDEFAATHQATGAAIEGVKSYEQMAAQANQTVDQTGERAETRMAGVAANLGLAAKAGQQLGLTMFAVNEATAEFYRTIQLATPGLTGGDPRGNEAIRNLNAMTERVNKQGMELQKRLGMIEKAMLQHDPLAKYINRVAAEFDTLGMDMVRQLAQAEKQLDDATKAARAKRDGASTTAGQAPVAVTRMEPVKVEITVAGDASLASSVDPAALTKLGDQLAGIVVQRIERSRSISSSPRRR